MIDVFNMAKMPDEDFVRVFELGIEQKNYPSDRQCVVMQFTGLTDKNGKEIYEGDILKYVRLTNKLKEAKDILFVEWCTWSYALFKMRNNERSYFTILDKIISIKCEIIGNIYENPELLLNQ
jgi:uncharacterized phage protein (TIGR01671 family)